MVWSDLQVHSMAFVMVSKPPGDWGQEEQETRGEADSPTRS